MSNYYYYHHHVVFFQPKKYTFSLTSLFSFSLNEFCISVQFSSVVSDSLWPHGLQHTRPPCPSPTLGAGSDSCPLSWWYHPTISSSVVPCSSCLHSFPASGSFSMSQFFTPGSQSTGVSVLWMYNEYSGLYNECLGLISFIIHWLDLLAVQGTLKSLLQPHSSKASIFQCSPFFIAQLTSIYDYWRNHSFD